VGRILGSIAIAALVSGCAVSGCPQGAEGCRVYAIGISWTSVDDTAAKERLAGETIDVTTFGFAVKSNPVESGFALGYARDILTLVRNDAAYIGRLRDADIGKKESKP
jgi:hypothetical protein